MSGKSKKPKTEYTPNPKKKPVITIKPYFKKNGKSILFCFDRFDFTGKWLDKGEKNVHDVWDIFSKLQHFERMTWADLACNSKRDHPIPFTKINPEAQKKAADLCLDLYDEIWSFHLNGKKRLWGVKDERFFLAIWWDPHHKICPSEKKHTQ